MLVSLVFKMTYKLIQVYLPSHLNTKVNNPRYAVILNFDAKATHQINIKIIKKTLEQDNIS